MYSIDQIMDMLDSNNPVSIQEKAVKLAQEIKSINVFLQPANPGNTKNVWENCAKVLASKEDELLLPYTINLLEWLQDLNWPGALIILERLKNFTASEIFIFSVESCVKRAKACNDQIWLDYLSELLDNENLKVKISGDTLDELKKHYNNWGAS